MELIFWIVMVINGINYRPVEPDYPTAPRRIEAEQPVRPVRQFRPTR